MENIEVVEDCPTPEKKKYINARFKGFEYKSETKEMYSCRCGFQHLTTKKQFKK